MEGSSIDFDPDGNLILILHNPGAPFAVWPQDGNCHLNLQQTALALCPSPRQSSSTVMSSNDALKPGDADDRRSESSHMPIRPLKPIIRLRLSSRHLILASPYFQKMLKGDWQESTAQSRPERVVKAEDWDPGALFVLMNIIHGRNGKVPLCVDIEMLSKIAALVDYYQCYEAVHIVSAIWLKELRQRVPSALGRDLVLWLLISWVYQDPALFETVTRTAIITMKSPFPSLGLPIPQIIAEAINSRREAQIQQILDVLDDLQQYLLKDQSGHSFECSSILFGALMKELHRAGLLGQDLCLSIHDLSIESTMDALDKIKSTQWKAMTTGTSFGSSTGFGPRCYSGHGCHLQSIIQSKLKGVDKTTVAGIRMAEFRDKNDTQCATASLALSSHLSGLSLCLNNVPNTRSAAMFVDVREIVTSTALSRFENICVQQRFANFSQEELRLGDSVALQDNKSQDS
ncbi:uncharacterized protein B0I36DRAFT_337098 [Microdochium trichocladiopsis]|uniref:BTB domain-containing protein n=1 Tax=Microdochium trichocladiopsis TaxID=1682393 RepID=A0A9P8XW57_9PEZI|nr:uncharacterized protein B0I36DRAFT_337098 [Microdochium trichocladiopsis]KAH7016235.1 hypothetical protein B0I36DRAFT_337098 [Microdochium trichocladiopsis]